MNAVANPKAANGQAEKPAAPAAPPAVPRITTETLTADLRQAFTAAPPPPAKPAAPEPPASPAPAAANGEATLPLPEPAPAAPAKPAAPAPEGEPADWPKGAIDTVTALRADRRELRADLDAERARAKSMEKRLSKLEGKEPEPEAVPIAHADPEVNKLQQEEEKQNHLATWARGNLRALARDPERVKASLKSQNLAVPDDPEVIAEFLAGVQDRAELAARDVAIRRAVAVERATNTARSEQQTAGQVARTALPELADPASPRSKLFALALEQHPELKRHARGELVAAAIVLGWEQLHATLTKQQGQAPAPAAPANPPAKPAAPRLPGAAQNVPAQVHPGAGDTADALFAAYKKSGSQKDKDAWIRATLFAN